MILAIDAATTSASVALYDNNRILADFTINNGYTHSQNLLPLIDVALNFAGKCASDVTDVITSNGPGSFTGIRIALSTAKAFCHGSGAKVYTVSTLKALAYHGKYTTGTLICSILNARRQQVYVRIEHSLGYQALSDKAMPITELLDFVDDELGTEEKALFVGDGVLEFAEIINQRVGERAILGSLEDINSSALGLIYAHLEGQTVLQTYDEVNVNYLRKPQAERERQARINHD